MVMCVNLYSEALKDMVCIVSTSTAGAALFGAIVVVGMIILLITGDIADTSVGVNFKLFTRLLTIAVIPLLIVSTFIVIMELLTFIS